MSTVAVIGGAGGIGRAVVAHLAARGDEVIVLDLLASLARHPGTAPEIPIDVLDEAAVDRAAATLRSRGVALDGLVNLAGYTRDVRPLSETPLDMFDDVVAGNLRGTFLSTKAMLPLMAEGGAIVLMASGLGAHVRPGHGAYAASKAGIVALCKTLAVECAPRLRVNTVAPGLVETAFLTGGTGRSDERGTAIVSPEAALAAVPMRRHATPEDIAGPVAFLLGPAAGFMTGQVLWVNGGSYMP